VLKTRLPVILLLLISVNIFYGLGAYPLADNNEGLYAEIAREILQTGQWIIPHVNGVPYLEKPPLLYWLMAACFKLGGINEWMARLVPALSALFTVLLPLTLLRFTERPRAYWLASVIMASSLGFAVIAHIVFFDMLLTLWISLSLIYFYQWWLTDSKFCLRIAYMALGLAILSKGFSALVLIPGIVLITLLWNKVSLKKFLKLFDVVGIALLLLLTVPWHVLAMQHQTYFAWQYFVNEHWLRFLNQRIPHDYYNGPWYYHSVRILILFLPWSLLLPLLAKRRVSTPLATLQLTRLLWAWVLLPLLFFSLSAAKANYYMVVCLPALALLLGLSLDSLMTHRSFICLQAVALLSIPMLITLNIWASRAPERFSQKPLFSAMTNPNATLYLYQDFENISSTGFYAAKPVQIIDSQSSDLYFAYHHGYPGFVTLARFYRDCRQNPCYLIVTPSKYQGLQMQLIPLKFKKLAATLHAVLLSNS
jgi:4-amino-4-deoxy-L-arabinose transferase-like glycosyltransferase